MPDPCKVSAIHSRSAANSQKQSQLQSPNRPHRSKHGGIRLAYSNDCHFHCPILLKIFEIKNDPKICNLIYISSPSVCGSSKILPLLPIRPWPLPDLDGN